MAASRNDSVGWVLALAAYVLFAAGCHGWVPALLQPFLIAVLGGVLLVLAGPGRVGGPLAVLRFVPLLVGVWGRQTLGVDLLASLGILLGLLLVADHPGDGTSRRRLIGRALLVVALVQLALSTGLGFHFEESLAGLLSAGASMWTGQTVQLGPVFGGGRMLLLCTALLWALTRTGAVRWTVLLAFQVVLAVAVTGAVGWTAAHMPRFGSTPSIMPIASVGAAQLPWLPFLLGALSVPLLVRWSRPPEDDAGGGRLVGALAVVTAGFVLASLPPAALRPVEKLVFYRPGFSNWEVAEPDLARAGPFSTGMLGSLPQFGRAMGLQVDLVDTIDAETLRDCDTLVLVNQNEPLNAGAPAEVSKWIHAGGHLVVVGDHTFLYADGDGWTNFLNGPLADCRIRFPNNSSDHLTQAFLDATVASGFGRRLDCVPGNPHSPIIGAGLHLEWPARPIVIGRFGFEDLGQIPDEERDKAIGDLAWNVGERLGGVVLLAEQQVGAGRTTVVGDTTGFHNIARSIAWRATGSLILGTDRDSRWSYWASALALLVLAGATLGGFRLWRPVPRLQGPLLWIAVLGAVATLGNLDRSPVPLSSAKEPLMILDTGVMPAGRRGHWSKDGYLTLISTAMRVGYLPLFTSTAEHGIPVGTKVILLSRPQVDPGPVWRERLMEWVRGGGHLILTGTHAVQSIHGELLDEIGCAIDPLVIGPQSVRVGNPNEQGFTLRLQESWNLRLLRGEWVRLVYGQHTATMASRKLGDGKVTVITDQTFLQNRNQENEETINPQNIRFTMHLLRSQGRLW